MVWLSGVRSLKVWRSRFNLEYGAGGLGFFLMGLGFHWRFTPTLTLPLRGRGFFRWLLFGVS